jgi:hypothetical protein
LFSAHFFFALPYLESQDFKVFSCINLFSAHFFFALPYLESQEVTNNAMLYDFAHDDVGHKKPSSIMCRTKLSLRRDI